MLSNMMSFFKSFVYAFKGIITAIKTQRNFRIHIVAMIYITAFSVFYELTKVEYMILVLTFVAVISLELINTALEAIVDICSPEYSKLAEIGKDCAAGAVLVSAMGAIVVAVFMFGDINIFKEIINYYRYNLLSLAGLIICTVVSMLFIFCPICVKKGKDNGYKN